MKSWMYRTSLKGYVLHLGFRPCFRLSELTLLCLETKLLGSYLHEVGADTTGR